MFDRWVGHGRVRSQLEPKEVTGDMNRDLAGTRLASIRSADSLRLPQPTTASWCPRHVTRMKCARAVIVVALLATSGCSDDSDLDAPKRSDSAINSADGQASAPPA